jgi:HK97 family phage major capsid protein
MARKYVNPNRQDGGRLLGLESMPVGYEETPEFRQALQTQQRARAADAIRAQLAPAASLNGMYKGWGDFASAVATDPQRVARIQAAARGGLSERIPSEGGFAVPEELRSDLVLASLESAIIRPRATVVPGSTLRTGLPVVDDTTHSGAAVFGGLVWEWTEEGAPLGQTDPAFSRLTMTARKLAAYLGAVPNELLADAPAFGAWVKRWVPAGLAWSEDQAFINGTGVGQPQGILNAPAAIAVTRQTSSEVTFTDVIKMQERMLPSSLRAFIWLCSPDVLIWLLQIYLNFGSALSGIAPPPDWLKYSETANCWTLLGRPLFPTEHVSALGAAGDLVAVDPSFYTIVDRQLLQMTVGPSGKGFVTDESEIKFTSRLDGRIWMQSPLTPANGSETVSCVAVLH